MARLWRFLRSPRLAVGILVFLALYCGSAAWLPWQRPGSAPPAWFSSLHLDHPFSSPAFIAATGLLFLSTAVCTWDRTLRLAALSRGQVRPWGTPFPSATGGARFDAFCRAEGFRGRGPVLFRGRVAIWGGWVLHTGLLALMGGVLIQQAFHDGGAFEVAEGEVVRLDAPGTVFERERGPFAPESPPAFAVALAAFDPYLHQKGYAPDRACLLRVDRPGESGRQGPVDRAAGFDAGPVTIYQALPTGLSLNLEIPDLGLRSLHLRDETHQKLTGDFTAPGGKPFRFVLETERHFDDPAGTGLLRIRAEGASGAFEVAQGSVFPFGSSTARLVSVGRWGGFTYSRSPGMPAVFAGFGLLLLGSALLTLPAGVALVGKPGENVAGWIWVSRGRDVLLAEWSRSSLAAATDGGS